MLDVCGVDESRSLLLDIAPLFFQLGDRVSFYLSLILYLCERLTHAHEREIYKSLKSLTFNFQDRGSGLQSSTLGEDLKLRLINSSMSKNNQEEN